MPQFMSRASHCCVSPQDLIPHPSVPLAAQLLWPMSVRRAVDCIERHIYEPLSIHRISEAACLSRFHMTRLFCATTGNTPMNYLRLRRIQQAKVMLRGGDRKISEIASDLCFFDQSHFVRIFRQVVGITPRSFAVAETSGMGARPFPTPTGFAEPLSQEFAKHIHFDRA